MGKPTFKHLEKLFHEAVALSGNERSAFLDAACAADADLRQAVEDLLRHAGTETTDKVLVSPVAFMAAQLRADAPTLPAPDAIVRSEVGPAPSGIPGYEILEELGRGGMGVVYKARQSKLNRIVALKMLLPHDTPAPETLARFRTEMATLAKLQHPNIIVIYDIGEYQGRPYFTMEYVAGPGLDRLLQGRPQDMSASARLIETLARTIHAVHQQGIIHRDLKPANVLFQRNAEVPLDTTGQNSRNVATPVHSAFLTSRSFSPKITDFGLAKDQAASLKITQTGVTMGTPVYMAPEQARSAFGPVGPGTDIYALGSILYEMLTGRPPFEAESTADVLNRLLHDEPVSPERLRPKLPPDLVTICMKCLEKIPSKRYASAHDLAEDLRRFLAGEPIQARAIGWLGRTGRWCRRRPLVAALIGLSSLLTIILVGTVLVYNILLSDALARLEVTAQAQRQQIIQLNLSIGISATESGDTFTGFLRFTEALRLDESDPHPEWQRQTRTHIAAALRRSPRLLRLLVEDRHILCTRLGAGGGWIATLGPGNVVEIKDVATNRALGQKLKLDDTPVLGALGPEGRFLAAVTKDGTLHIGDMAAGTSRTISLSPNQAIQDAVMHPDGRILLTRHADGTMRRWDLHASQFDLPESLGGSAVQHAVLSTNCRWLATAADGVGTLWNVGTGQAVGTPLKLTNGVVRTAISPEGRRYAVLGTDHVLRIGDVQEAQWLRPAIKLDDAVTHMEFSPDGERLVTCSSRHGVQVWEVRTGERLFAHQVPTVTHAQFGPDSRMVLTHGQLGVRVWDAVTGHALTPPLRHGGLFTSAGLYIEGNKVITASRNGIIALWELPTPADQKADVAPPPDMRPVDHLVRLAKVLACGHIDDQQQVRTLEMNVLAVTWQSLNEGERK